MEYHYFASSTRDFQTSDNLVKLLKGMEKLTLANHLNGFTVWLVPLPQKSTYQIDDYAPQVEGAVRLFRHFVPASGRAAEGRTVPSMDLAALVDG